MALNPFTGANTPLFYCEELTPGVTPASPAWKYLRTASGMPTTQRDLTESNELNDKRDSSRPRLGNKQVTGELSVEYTAASQDDILAGAMMGVWELGETEVGLDITVDATDKTFTRAAGDFTSKVAVGDYMAFTNLTGENAKPFFVTAVTATVITAGETTYKLTDENVVSATYKTAQELRVGSVCKTFSVLAVMKGTCGTATEYLISRGVRFVGFNLEAAVNSMVTGASSIIGMTQEVLTSIPAGTFEPSDRKDPFHAVDAVAFEGAVRLTLVDNFNITNDNTASPQFELGNDSVAFVEVGKAKNTFSATGKVASLDMFKMSLGDTSSTFKVMFSNNDGSLAFKLNNCTFSVTPERGGPESITQEIAGQAAIADDGDSSMVIYRIVY
jgi:hypothetical protein